MGRPEMAEVGRETWPAGSSGGVTPPWPARVAAGWSVMPPTAQNPTARKWVKTTQFGVHDLGAFLSRVLELKVRVLGLGFHLALKSRFIYGLGSFSGKKTPDRLGH